MGTSDAFSLLPAGEPLYLEEDGEWHTFADLVGSIDPDLRPTDGEGLSLFLLCYDAWPAHEPPEAA